MKRGACIALWMNFAWLASEPSWAVENWSGEDYDLHAGDFNGDRTTDLLFIARDPARPSGIVLSDGTGLRTLLQTWGNAWLGIPWTGGLYNVLVADFDGDGRDDILLQRGSAGDHYLLLTEDGGIGGISQTIANDACGVDWSADRHRVLAGDFNGDSKADLFLQPTDASGLSAVLVADEQGQFSCARPAQSWNDGYAGFRWAIPDATVFAADYNGDGLSDLLLQAQPLNKGNINRPVEYAPNMNGVILAQAAKQPFVAEGVQAWSREGFSADWSPLNAIVVVGDYNGDGRADVLLQGVASHDASYLLYGRPIGPVFSAAISLDAGSVPASATHRAIAGRFAGDRAADLYFQARSPAQSNSVGRIRKSTVTMAAFVMSPEMSADPDVLRSDAPEALSAAVVTPTSAGRTPGQFAVSAMGGATYQIPIWTPLGARGLDPNLALVYSSGGPDGPLGPGWSLSGLSVLARCNKTYAANGGSPAAVALSMTDEYCLDGNRLRLVSGTYGAAGSVYQTEIADFSRVTAHGSAGNGPSYFVVEDKDGLKYEYGNTVDSKAYASAGATPYAWLLNKTRDRQGNNLIVTYSTTSGDIQPSSIQYAQTLTNGPSYPYSVSFSYQTRVTNLSKYVAGGIIQQTKVLSKINVLSSGISVRQYNLTYATAPATQRDRLTSIQECGGSAGSDCLRPTTISYQDGAAGVASPGTATGSGATSGTTNSVDLNADGREDLIFAVASGSSSAWWVQFSTGTGFGVPISTGAVTPTANPPVFDDFDANGSVDMLGLSGGIWYLLKWTGATFSWASTGLALDGSGGFVSADVNGDGLPDLVSYRSPDFKIYTRLNTSVGSNVTFAPTATMAFAVGRPIFALWGNYSLPQSSVRTMDFNGDNRGDVVIRYLGGGSWPNLSTYIMELFAHGSVFTNGLATLSTGSLPPLPVNWNSDACTDLAFGGKVWIAGCGLAYATSIPVVTPSLALDWDGDSRTDLLSNSNGT